MSNVMRSIFYASVNPLSEIATISKSNSLPVQFLLTMTNLLDSPQCSTYVRV